MPHDASRVRIASTNAVRNAPRAPSPIIPPSYPVRGDRVIASPAVEHEAPMGLSREGINLDAFGLPDNVIGLQTIQGARTVSTRSFMVLSGLYLNVSVPNVK